MAWKEKKKDQEKETESEKKIFLNVKMKKNVFFQKIEDEREGEDRKKVLP